MPRHICILFRFWNGIILRIACLNLDWYAQDGINAWQMFVRWQWSTYRQPQISNYAIKSNSLLIILVPDLDCKFSRTGDENVWEETVPLYGVYRGIVCVVGVQILRGILCGAQVDCAFVSPNQVTALVICLECQGSSNICIDKNTSILAFRMFDFFTHQMIWNHFCWNIFQSFAEVDNELVIVPKTTFDQSPIRNPAISRDWVKVEVVVQVVRNPLDLHTRLTSGYVVL